MTVEINVIYIVLVAIVPAFLIFAAKFKSDVSLKNQIKKLEDDLRASDENILELEQEMLDIKKSLGESGAHVVNFKNKTKAV